MTSSIVIISTIITKKGINLYNYVLSHVEVSQVVAETLVLKRI